MKDIRVCVGVVDVLFEQTVRIQHSVIDRKEHSTELRVVKVNQKSEHIEARNRLGDVVVTLNDVFQGLVEQKVELALLAKHVAKSFEY